MNTMTSNSLTPQHQRELESSALTDADILALRVFSANAPTAKRLTGYSLEGMLIPYLDPWGAPYIGHNSGPFHRLKPTPGTWEDCPKYLTPKGVGHRPYFPQNFDWPAFLKQKKRGLVILTEGEKTAAALCAAGYPTIGLCGISGWRDRSERLESPADSPATMQEDLDLAPAQLDTSRPIPELKEVVELLGESQEFLIMFDSDITHNYLIRNAAKNLAVWLNETGCDTSLVILPTEADGSKNGADDMIARHGKESIDLLIKHRFAALRNNPKDDEWELNIPSEKNLRHRVIMVQAALMRSWAYRPGYAWYQWNGKKWDFADDGQGTYLDAAVYALHEENDWAAPTNSLMNTLCRHLKAKSVVADKYWDQTQIVPFQNGVLDISTNVFRSHTSNDWNTKILTYSYNPEATAPTWNNFISCCLGEDPEAVRLVQALFRWALTPKGTGKLKLEICWDLFGRPGTGKGTTLETLRNLVGRDNAGTFKTSQLGNPNYLAQLKDKLCSISSDDSGHLEDVGQFGELVSNEPVGIKLLYQNATFTSLNTFFIRAYNDFVSTTGNNNSALDRRIVAMSFEHQPQERDVYLQEKLNAELSGVFNWAWSVTEEEMIDRVRRAGDVKAVAKASSERFEANNPVISFLKDLLPNGHPRAKPREIYKQYSEWSRENGRMALNSRQFGIKLEHFGAQRTGKIMGFFYWAIPSMEDMDVMAHLRLGNTTPTTVPTNQPVPTPTTNLVPVGQPRIEAVYSDDQLNIKRVHIWVFEPLVKQWEAFIKKCGFSLKGIHRTGKLVRITVGRVTPNNFPTIGNQNANYAPMIST